MTTFIIKRKEVFKFSSECARIVKEFYKIILVKSEIFFYEVTAVAVINHSITRARKNLVMGISEKLCFF